MSFPSNTGSPDPALAQLIDSSDSTLNDLVTQAPPPYQSLAIHAASHSNAPLLSHCLQHGAKATHEVQLAAWKGATPALYAALIDHGDWPRYRGLTLTQVLNTNYVNGASMIDFLVSRGAQITTDVILAVVALPMATSLAAHGANFKDTGALQLAASCNDVPVAKFLTDEAKVDVDEVPKEDTWDPRGCQNGTPLCRAFECKNVGVANFLVRKGASLEYRNEMGFTPGEIAERMAVTGWRDDSEPA